MGRGIIKKIIKLNQYKKSVLLLLLLLPILIYKYNNLGFKKEHIEYVNRAILTSPEKRKKNKRRGHFIEIKVKADKMRYWIVNSSYCATKDKDSILNLPKDSVIEIGIRGKFFFDTNLINYPQGRDEILELSYKGKKLIKLDDVNNCIRKDFRLIFYGWIMILIYNIYKVYNKKNK